MGREFPDFPYRHIAAYEHQHHVRWLIWWDGGRRATLQDRIWLRDYQAHKSVRIESAIAKAFWQEFSIRLQQSVNAVLIETNKKASSLVSWF